MITLYHGTDEDSARRICQDGIMISRCKEGTDFGKGFYMTPDMQAAIRWAKRKGYQSLRHAALVTVTFDYEMIRDSVKMFQDDLEWAQFIINNRNGLGYVRRVNAGIHNLDSRYPITEGRIADYQVIKVAQDLQKEGKPITDVESILNPEYATQIVLHTEDALIFVKRLRYQLVD